MATGGKILDALKDEFCECPICTEEYDEEKHVPRLLPCQHSFCTECLQKSIKGGKLNCSICKRSYKVKEKGVDCFPKDLTKRSLGDVLQRIKASSCCICSRIEGIRYECTSCNIKVCKSCFKVRKSTECKHHRLKEISMDSNKTPDSSLDSLEMSAENICNLPFHEKNTLKFYCKNKDCRKPICANCTTKDHKYHDWDEIDLYYKKEKETVLSRLSLAKEKIEKAKGVLSYIKKENEKIMENDNTGKAAIQNEKQNGIDYLNQEIEELCQTSTQIVKEYTETFEKKMSFLTNFIENAQECCSISEELLKESKVSFLSLEKTISEKLEKFGKESFPEEKSNIDSESLLLKDECTILRKRIEKMKDPYLEMDDNSLFEMTPEGQNDRGVPVVRLKKIPRKHERVKSFLTKSTWFMIKILTGLAAILFIIREFDIWWDLPYCEVKNCDEAVLSFSDNSNHSSFCRAKDGKVASSLSIKTLEQSCGNPNKHFVENGVLLNKSLNFSDGYDTMDFKIRLTDFSEESRGGSLLWIGFLQASTYNNETTEIFGWKLIRSKYEERLEMFNVLNTKIASISATSQTKIILKYRIQKDNLSRSIKIANLETKKILDTFHIPEKHHPILFVYFQFSEKYLVRISIKSLSNRVAFNADSIFPNVYLSNNNKTAQNYLSPNQADIVRSNLTQDIKILNCEKLCVFPFTISIPPFSLNADHWFDIYFGSITSTEEMLFLSDETCTLSYILYYVFGYITKCLSVNKNLVDSEIPNLNINGTFDCVLIIDKEHNTTNIDINSYKYNLPFPGPLRHPQPVLRIKVHTANSITISLSDKRKYLYKFSILNGCIISKIVTYLSNFVELKFLLVILLFFMTYKCFSK